MRWRSPAQALLSWLTLSSSQNCAGSPVGPPRRVSGVDAPLDHRLALNDQARFLAQRATGLTPVAQWVWVYDRSVDLDGLKRFHRNLGYGLLGRRIERSPLPFGRHRWVCSPASADIDIARYARPRAELIGWADERAQLPLDPQWGPGWHVGVQPFSDGSTAVSLVASHCLVDGAGGCLAIVDAVKGNVDSPGYPLPGSRSRARAVVSDALHTARGLPAIVQALIAAARQSRHRSRGGGQSGRSERLVVARGNDDAVAVPAIAIHIDVGDWDTRAAALGGSSNALFTAFAAKLGERVGCRRANDGAIRVGMTVNDRAEGDTRANAFSLATIDIDLTRITSDLSNVRAGIRRALGTFSAVRGEQLKLLPLIALMPEWAARRLAHMFLATPAVGCSYLGDVDPAVGRPDGTEADSFFVRGVTQHVSRQIVEQVSGMTAASAARIGGTICIAVTAYQSVERRLLGELAAATLAEFNLTGLIV